MLFPETKIFVLTSGKAFTGPDSYEGHPGKIRLSKLFPESKNLGHSFMDAAAPSGYCGRRPELRPGVFRRVF